MKGKFEELMVQSLSKSINPLDYQPLVKWLQALDLDLQSANQGLQDQCKF